MKPLGWERLRAYQKTAALALASGEKHGTFVGAGLGKTSIILTALGILDPPAPWLFLTRAIGRHVFGRDARWVLGPDYVPGVLWAGSERSKDGRHRDGTYTGLEALLSERWACVSNYEVLDKRIEELVEIPWGALVLDESHAIKSGYQRLETKRDGTYYRKRFHFCKELASRVRERGGPVWLMTATPIKNRRPDLWGQLDVALGGSVISAEARGLVQRGYYPRLDGKFVAPGEFGPALVYREVMDMADEVEPISVEDRRSFLGRYCDAQKGEYGLDFTGKSMTAELKERLKKHFIVLNRRAVADELPKMQRDVLEVTPDRESRDFLGGGIENAIARAAASKLSPAVEIAMSHIASGERVLIAVSRKRLIGFVLTEIRKQLKELPRATREKLTIDSVTGEIPVAHRVPRLRAFNETKDPAVMVATLDSLRESIDLHYVECAIVLSLPYTPGDVDQFEGRFARLGGVPSTIHYLVATDTIDEKIREVLLDRLADVVEVGTDTAGAASAHAAIAGSRSDEEIVAELRAWLKD